MPERPDTISTGTHHQRLEQEIERKVERKLRARQQEDRTGWFWLGMFGLVGWSIAIPTVVGIAAGIWIDNRWSTPASWTLTLLIVGVALGCLNAWYWVKQESRRD